MGVVLPFTEIKRARPTSRAQMPTTARGIEAIAEAIRATVDQSGALAAAKPLLDRCCDRYGFIVMQDGLPREPAVLARLLIELDRALAMLDAEMCPPRTYPTFGVYFGRQKLSWFEDGYSGTTALAVPNNTAASTLADFVRPRIAAGRPRAHQ